MVERSLDVGKVVGSSPASTTISAKAYDILETSSTLSQMEYRSSTPSSGATLSGIGAIPVKNLGSSLHEISENDSDENNV